MVEFDFDGSTMKYEGPAQYTTQIDPSPTIRQCWRGGTSASVKPVRI